MREDEISGVSGPELPAIIRRMSYSRWLVDTKFVKPNLDGRGTHFESPYREMGKHLFHPDYIVFKGTVRSKGDTICLVSEELAA